MPFNLIWWFSILRVWNHFTKTTSLTLSLRSQKDEFTERCDKLLYILSLLLSLLKILFNLSNIFYKRELWSDNFVWSSNIFNVFIEILLRFLDHYSTSLHQNSLRLYLRSISIKKKELSQSLKSIYNFRLFFILGISKRKNLGGKNNYKKTNKNNKVTKTPNKKSDWNGEDEMDNYF